MANSSSFYDACMHGQPGPAVAEHRPARSGCETKVAPVNPVSTERIGECLRMVELALQAGHEERAIAAVQRAFLATVEEAQSVRITDHSPLVDLGLDTGIVNALEQSGIVNVGQLCRCTRDALAAVRNFRHKRVEVIIAALAEHGLQLKSVLADQADQAMGS